MDATEARDAVDDTDASEAPEAEGSEAATETAAGAPTVYQQLLSVAEAATGKAPQPKHAKESDKEYLGRLVRAASKLDEGEWNSLPADFQNWWNDAVEALNEERAIPNPPGYTAGRNVLSDEPKKRSGREALAEYNRRRKEEKERRAQEEATKPAKLAPAAGERSAASRSRKPEGGEGIVTIIRKLVVRNPDWTVQQLADAIAEMGREAKSSTLVTARHDTLATIGFAKEAGRWKD
jgi:hypothetical protein